MVTRFLSLVFFAAFAHYTTASASTEDTTDRNTSSVVLANNLPKAQKGDPDAAFNVANAYIIKAAVLRKRGGRVAAIKSMEDEAIGWFRKAAKKGHEDAEIMLEAVERHGRKMLYISIEHIPEVEQAGR